MSKNNNERQLRQLSLNHYERTVEYLFREAGSKSLDVILKYVKNKEVKPTTKFNYLNSIVSLKKADPDSFPENLDAVKAERDNLREIINKANSKCNMTDRQKAVMAVVKLDDIKKVIDKLGLTKDTSLKDLEDYIILNLMVNEPVRNDLMDIKIVRRKSDLGTFNAIYLPVKKGKKATIKIVEHKTSSAPSGKPIVNELSTELTSDVINFIKRSPYAGKNREFLFQDRDGKAYSSSAFSHKFQRLFKKHLKVPFSSTTLRKIFWTDTYGEREKAMQRSAGNMAHSIATVRKYYIKNDD